MIARRRNVAPHDAPKLITFWRFEIKGALLPPDHFLCVERRSRPSYSPFPLIPKGDLPLPPEAVPFSRLTLAKSRHLLTRATSRRGFSSAFKASEVGFGPPHSRKLSVRCESPRVHPCLLCRPRAFSSIRTRREDSPLFGGRPPYRAPTVLV